MINTYTKTFKIASIEFVSCSFKISFSYTASTCEVQGWTSVASARMHLSN